jgi:alcohol dehydrogenase class IV
MAASSVSAYEFLSPARIVFGWGRLSEVGPLAADIGRRAFLVVGSRTLAADGTVDALQNILRENRVEPILLATIDHEPLVADVDQSVAEIRRHQIREGDIMLGLGGGSAIDLAKAVAALATNTAGATVTDYLEGVGRGLTISERPLNIVAIPTTAGTGSEATKNAVISSYDPPFKKSLRSEWMLPRLVIVDPQLAVSVPPAITAQTGMDAITQLIESYISRKARAIPQALAAGGLPLALGAIVEAVENGNSRPAREAMAQAALLSGMALANSGLGMAHGVAAALGVHQRVAHGLACATMLPTALRINRQIAERPLAELGRAAGLSIDPTDSIAAEALIRRIDEICEHLGVPPRLSELGVAREDIPVLARDSRGNSMDGNPRTLSDAELTEILEALL